MLSYLASWFVFGFSAVLGGLLAIRAVKSPIVQSVTAFVGAALVGLMMLVGLAALFTM